MRDIISSNRYERGIKRLKKRGFDFRVLKIVQAHLLNGIPLPRKYRDHLLQGDKYPCRDCHLGFDIVLIYRIDKSTLYLDDIGTHEEVFK